MFASARPYARQLGIRAPMICYQGALVADPVSGDWLQHRPLGVALAREVSPVLVVEVLSLDEPDKDLVRNVDLYLRVPSIKEYWLIDSRESATRPTMTAYRRHGKRWRTKRLAFGDRYTTPLLPGFELVVDPRAR